MAWLKTSDTAAHHEVVYEPMAWPLDECDGVDPADLVNLLYGLASRCAVHSAQYTSDYVIPDGVVATMAGPHWRRRAAQVAKAGYWTRNTEDTGWVLVDDAEHLFHIRRRAEIDWERARKRDIANPRLIVPVRLRDGDGCRYCGRIVQWNARRGGRAGTYDHREPGKPAATPDGLVVCCAQCNSGRGTDADPQAWPLRPAPAEPLYGELTARLLAEHGFHVPITRAPIQGADAIPRGRTQWHNATSEPGRDAEPPQGRSDVESADAVSADSPDRGYAADRNPGRVGDGSGRPGSARRKRGRRGGRGAGGSSERR